MYAKIANAGHSYVHYMVDTRGISDICNMNIVSDQFSLFTDIAKVHF